VGATVVVLALGCGSPTFDDCAVTCSAAMTTCPGGMSCRASGFCVSDDHADVCGAADARPSSPDATAIVDAMIVSEIDGPACGVPDGCQGAPVTCAGASSCYAVCGNPVELMTAAEICSGWGGTLLVVDSVGENACIERAISPFSIWIDLVQGTGASDPSVGWLWSSAGDPSYTNWGSAQPDDEDLIEDDQQNCAIMIPGGGWDDESCGSPHPFACERLVF